MSEIGDKAYEAALKEAAELGRNAGGAAASWVIDGNTDIETIRALHQGLEDGDPAVLDSLRVPDLSGEYADAMTPAKLAEELGFEYDDPDYSEIADDIETAWMDGASEGFFDELGETIGKALEGEGNDD